jgi:hypothetical protein
LFGHFEMRDDWLDRELSRRDSLWGSSNLRSSPSETLLAVNNQWIARVEWIIRDEGE